MTVLKILGIVLMIMAGAWLRDYAYRNRFR